MVGKTNLENPRDKLARAHEDKKLCQSAANDAFSRLELPEHWLGLARRPRYKPACSDGMVTASSFNFGAQIYNQYACVREF